jgi:hypothetical protein
MNEPEQIEFMRRTEEIERMRDQALKRAILATYLDKNRRNELN